MQKPFFASASGALIFCATISFVAPGHSPEQVLTICALMIAGGCHAAIGYLVIGDRCRTRQVSGSATVFCALVAVFWAIVAVAASILLASTLQLKLAQPIADWLLLGSCAASLVLAAYARRELGVRRTPTLRGNAPAAN